MTKRARFFILAGVLSLALLLPYVVPAANYEANKLLDRGRFEFEDGNYEDALAFIGQAIKLEPTNLNYQRFRAIILSRLKRYQEAIAVLNKVLATDPVGQQAALIELANIYAAMKDHVNAEIHYTKAILLFPKRPDLYMSRGLTYLEMKNYESAESDFRRVAEIDPKLASFAFYHLAVVSYKKEDYAQAKERLEKAIALKPDKALLQSCQKFLINIKTEEKARRRARAVVTVMLQYDDNVTNQPLEAAGLLPVGVPVQDQSDRSLGASFLGSYRFINQREAQLGLSYNFLVNFYEHLRTNDLQAHTLSLFYNRYRDPLYFRIHGDYSYYLAANVDKMKLYSLNPSLTWAINATNRLDFLISLQQRNMLDGTPNVFHYIDSTVYYHDFLFEENQVITFRTGFQLEYDEPQENTAPNYHLYQFQTGLTFPSLFGCVPDIGLKYTSVKYAQFDPFDVSKEREDIRWDVTIRISRRITDSIQIMFLWTHTVNDSNLKIAGDVDPYEFARNVCTFLISGTF